MSASLLLLSGKFDTVWPSTEMADRIIKRLDQSGYSYPYKHIAYYGGHDILKKSTLDILTFIRSNYPARTNNKTANPKQEIRELDD